jgi:hypothetical protein
MVWVHDHTDSLLAIVLMHAPLAAGQMVLIPPTLTSWQIVTYNLLFTLFLWDIVATAIRYDRKRAR